MQYPGVSPRSLNNGSTYIFRCPHCMRLVWITGDEANYAHNRSDGRWMTPCGHGVTVPNLF
jgi:hypothetical protein